MTPSLAYIVTARTFLGRKKCGQVAEFDWEWKLSAALAARCRSEYEGLWYALVRRPDGWYLIGKVGCAWDFATKFIAFDWVIEASLGHDILHWLIAKGILPEACNDLIDHELAEIAKVRGKAPRWRRWYIEKATNLVNEKATGEDRKVYYLYGYTGRY